MSIVQSLSNGVPQNTVSENNSDSSDLEILEIKTDNGLKKPSGSMQGSKSLKAVGKSIDRWERNNSDTSSRSKDRRSPTRRTTSKWQRLSPHSPLKTMTIKSLDGEHIEESGGSSSESSSNNEQGFVTSENKNKEKWWLDLRPPNKYHVHGLGQKPRYHTIEEKLMITFVVVKNLIHDATSLKPWKAFIDAGYLKHRTVDSLNNHFRKILLPAIASFQLPADIEKKFVDCRKLHIGRKKIKV